MYRLTAKKPFTKTNNLFIAYCLLPIAHCLLPITINAQATQTIIYTTKENLPSNSVYKTLVDNKGFLWVATENGLARFDGKIFRSYTTKDGLSDNEVIDMCIDKKGTVWIIPFRGKACFYNQQKDRFENEESVPYLKKMVSNTPLRPFDLQYGNIIFGVNAKALYLVKDSFNIKITENGNVNTGSVLNFFEYQKDKIIMMSTLGFQYINNNVLDATTSIKHNEVIEYAEIINDTIYGSYKKGIIVYTVDKDGVIKKIAQKEYPFEIMRLSAVKKDIALVSASGSIYMVDNKSLEIKDEVFGNFSIRYIMKDNENNIWLSTLAQGLVKLQVKRISSFENEKLKQNLTAIYKDKFIYAGNNNGEILKFDGLYNIQNVTNKSQARADATVREIVKVGNNLYGAMQNNSVVFNPSTGKIVYEFGGGALQNRSTKCASVLNDSILLLGGHARATKYNWKTNKTVDSIIKRTVSIGSNQFGDCYIGSNDGLFAWEGNKLEDLGKLTKGLTYRVNTIFTTSDNLTWVGLATDSLIVIKQKQIIASIPLGRLIPGNICKALYSYKPGEIWLGTNEGLNRIRYNFTDKLNYTTTYFGIEDGLAGKQVNDIFVQDSIVYVATSSGISYLPVSLQLPIAEIATFITGVSVNNAAVDLKGNYVFKHNKNNITIAFSGVDLTGYLPLFEFSLNNSTWQQLQTDRIELKNQAPGSYTVKIRAIRRDGLPSTKEAALSFVIKTPFWKSGIFWTFFAFSVFGAILYFQQKRNKQKQKTALEKITTEKRLAELEMQALKAQINPHFVFNCLNSIKGFIYDKDYLQADKYLDKFSQLMRSTIDNSDASVISLHDEILYLENYLQLEKLRFEEKFNYSFYIDKNIDTQKIFVPVMLLQPYVENAIRHGMRFLENKQGHITISATVKNNTLVCTIDDDGIGREKAAELKSKAHIEYQSKGMSISKRRAELYDIEQEIIDKKDANNNAKGTTIIVKIPLTLQP